METINKTFQQNQYNPLTELKGVLKPSGSLQLPSLLDSFLKYYASLSKNDMKLISSELAKIRKNKYSCKQKYFIPVDERIWDSVQELKDFLANVNNPFHKLYWTLMAWTGLRDNEVKILKVKDFDLENEEVYAFVSKNLGNYVKIPLPHKLCEELLFFFKYLRVNGDLFRNKTNMRKEFRDYCKKLGGKYDKSYVNSLDDRPLYFFNQHSLRKFYQTLIANNSDLLGRALHDSVDVARKHYWTQKERIRKIINELY